MQTKKFFLLAGIFSIAGILLNPVVSESKRMSDVDKSTVTDVIRVSEAKNKIDPIDAMIQWATNIANDPVHGYSQGAENATARNPYTGSREGVDYDCSSLVYWAMDYAYRQTRNPEFNLINAWRKNPECYSRYKGEQVTGDADTIWMDMAFINDFQGNSHWKKFAWNDVKNDLKRGDILCYPEEHVAIYIGDGKTVEARGVNNPRGGEYRTGDQGGEIDFYEAQNRNWTEVYRYDPAK